MTKLIVKKDPRNSKFLNSLKEKKPNIPMQSANTEKEYPDLFFIVRSLNKKMPVRINKNVKNANLISLLDIKYAIDSKTKEKFIPKLKISSNLNMDHLTK